MKILLIIILILILWIIPGYMAWLYFHKAYSKNGMWYGLKPERSDIYVVIIPICNIIWCISWIVNYPIKSNNDSKSICKFFKIKSD